MVSVFRLATSIQACTMKFSLLTAIFLVTCTISSASRILFLFPSPSKSHVIVAQGLSKALVEKGHHVTMVSPFPLSKPIKNHREIKINMKPEMENFASGMVKQADQPRYKTIMRSIEVFRMVKDMANDMLEMPEFKKLMAEEKFDLVVIGMFFHNFLVGVGDHFNCPTLMLSVNVAMTASNLVVGNPLSVSAVPNILSGSSRDMNFSARVKNFLMQGVEFGIEAFMYRWQKNFYEYKLI